jgi:crossover junction endodeoxyribonuclease RuvC
LYIADALGLAITHAHAGLTMQKIADAGGTRRTSAMYKGGRSY